jgi:ABC-type lipoprotein release transport system permease subunit
MKIMTLASRNVLRNWHRTLVTTSAMAFACIIMIFFSSLMEGMVIGSERQAVILNQGDIQIHAKGYRDDPDIYTTIKNSKALATEIRKKSFFSTTRRYAFGLVANEGNSSGVQLSGLDLVYEQQVTEIHKHVMTGLWLDEKDRFGVVIGKKLARLLDAKVGSEMVFIGQTADGYMANELFTVRGILKSISSSIDTSSVFLSNKTLIEMLALPDGAHEIVIMRQNRNTDLTLATNTIKILTPEYETLNWRELMPVIARFLETADIQSLIMLIFTYIAVASVILNAMLMSVFERIHEFGIMKAIGVTPKQTVTLIYIETLLQTTIASIIGLAIGWWLSFYFETNGIDMSGMSSDFTFAGIALDPIWYTAITAKALFTPVFFLYVIAIIAVIYPAIKIAKIKAVDAIHYQ